jgi:hypothetical protein
VSQREGKKPADKRSRPESQSFVSLLVLGILGVTGMILYSLQFQSTTGMAVFGVSIGIAGGTLLLGALLGFLFGIPRTIQAGERQQTGRQEEGPSSQPHPRYEVNTNLEQISDWLTKILVGVGLIQLGAIGGALSAFGDFLRPALGDLDSSPPYAVGIILYFGVLGFLTGYLQTRLFLSPAFRAADIEELGERVSQVEETAEKGVALAKTIKDQQLQDAQALSLLQRQLEPDPDADPIPQEDFDLVLDGSSQPVKVQVFFRAHAVRRDNWRPPGDPKKAERTIPIFRALISIDAAGKYHRNHAQLGYALKDKEPPDLPAAVEALTEAIRRRDVAGEGRTYPFYEFNRAQARIRMQLAAHRAASNAEDKAAIVDDLKKALRSPYVRSVVEGDQEIKTWMEANGVTLEELRRTRTRQ